MIAPTPRVVAMLPLTDADDPVLLERTVARLRHCRELDGVAVVCLGRGAEAIARESVAGAPGASVHRVQGETAGDRSMMRRALAGRKWSPTAWRGGLGGATCYDERLAPAALAEAMPHTAATAALLVGPDWPLVDPALCDRAIARHLEQPDHRRLVFTQAPPGLCGIVVARSLLAELAAAGRSIGSLLEYDPDRPIGDPIATDACVQTDPAVRHASLRAVGDSPRWRSGIEALLGSNGPPEPDTLDASRIVARLHADPTFPQQVTLELTPRRDADGELVPQRYTPLDREPMPLPLVERLAAQLGPPGDLAVTLGGLGDALLHPDWPRAVELLHDAGVWGLHVETDLRVEPDVLRRLIDLPIDVVSVRLNAESEALYERLMGGGRAGASPDRGGCAQVKANIDRLLADRRDGLPWVVPRMVKTRDTVTEMEAFFDRWTRAAGHAVIDPPTTGAGLMPSAAVIDMAPPTRRPCRQLAHRMTVLSDGAVPRCDQDWLGREAVGNAAADSIESLWAKLRAVRDDHQHGRFEGACAACRQWHRP